MALTLNMIVFLTERPSTKKHGVKTAVIIPFARVCKLFFQIMNILSGKDMQLKYVIFPTKFVDVISDILNISKHSLVV